MYCVSYILGFLVISRYQIIPNDMSEHNSNHVNDYSERETEDTNTESVIQDSNKANPKKQPDNSTTNDNKTTFAYHRRQYRGNANYATLFDQHVKETFNPPKVFFRKSKVNRRMACRSAVGKDIYDKFQGSEWTSREKNAFFNSLSRNSIHQVDNIQEEVGTKTVLEIYTYYEVLKSQLKAYKLRRKIKSKDIKLHGLRHKYYYREPHLKLLSYQQIPFAYEMSPKFIHMEEIQARLIVHRESLLLNDVQTHLKKIAPETLFEEKGLKEVTRFLNLSEGIDKPVELKTKAEVFLQELVKQVVKKVILNLMTYNVEEITPEIMVRGCEFLFSTPKYRNLNLFAVATKDFYVYQKSKMVNKSSSLDKPIKSPVYYYGLNYQEPAMNPGWIPQTREDSSLPDESNDEIEAKMVEKETKYLNVFDKQESRKHEHIVLTWLSTYDQEKVKHSMFSEEEMQQKREYKLINQYYDLGEDSDSDMEQVTEESETNDSSSDDSDDNYDEDNNPDIIHCLYTFSNYE